MVFWIVAAALCLAVAIVIVRTGLASSAAPESTAAFDLRVYKDQLKAVENDIARGVLSEAEADAARAEIGKRVLAADAELREAKTATGSYKPGTWALGGAMMLAAGIALVTYLQIGAPGYPDLPLTTRIEMVEDMRMNRPDQRAAEEQNGPAPQQSVDPERLAMVQELREVMQSRPNDLQGLSLLVTNEAALGNFTAAYEAQSRMIELLGDQATGDLWVRQGELMIFAAGGYISPEAEATLLRGLELDPQNGMARYFIGQMYAQQGRPDLAFPIWANLLQEGPNDAPWITPIRTRIELVAFGAGVELDPSLLAPLRGPSDEDIAAAEALDPASRQAMIEGMVAGLSDRLATEGGPPEDWAQLIRAYGVLGRSNAAQIVHDDAQSVFADFPEALALIDDAFRAAMAQAGSLPQAQEVSE